MTLTFGTRPTRSGAVVDLTARLLRDGVLQEMLAVGLLVTAAQSRLEEDDTFAARGLLDDASETIGIGVGSLRALITTIGTRAEPGPRALTR